MRLSTKTIKAKDLPTDVFIYDELENLFFFVDDINHETDSVIAIHEIDIDENGVQTLTMEFDNEEDIKVVDDYRTPEF